MDHQILFRVFVIWCVVFVNAANGASVTPDHCIASQEGNEPINWEDWKTQESLYHDVDSTITIGAGYRVVMDVQPDILLTYNNNSIEIEEGGELILGDVPGGLGFYILYTYFYTDFPDPKIFTKLYFSNGPLFFFFFFFACVPNFF